jgi:hypothetical protein
VDFHRETLTPEFKAELEPLLVEHYKEISANQDIPLSPNWDWYFKGSEMGFLKVFTMREEKALVGYGVFIVLPAMHYSSCLQATQDILFLRKDLRGKLSGFRFIKWCDEQLKAGGVQVVYHHVKFAHDWGKLLERIGYKPIEKIYGRRLDK